MRLLSQATINKHGRMVEFTAERKYGGSEARALLARERRTDGAIIGFDGAPGGWYELRLGTSPFKDGTLLHWFILRGRRRGQHGTVQLVRDPTRFNGWSRFRDGTPFMRVARRCHVEVHWSAPR